MLQQLRINADSYSRPLTSEDRRRYDTRSPRYAWIVGGSTFAGLTLLLGPLIFFLGGMKLWLLGVAIAIAFAAGLLMFIVLIVPDKKEMRAKRFAAEHGFSYAMTSGGSGMQGVLFEAGTNKRTMQVFQLPGDVLVSNWEFEKTTDEKTLKWRFIELPLPRRVPHLVLDAVANNGLFGSNLPQGLARSQVIELEGDFARFFTVFAPSGYDFDVRYLLPPDTMALLADNLQHFDIELLDDRMRLVTNGSWDYNDPKTWQFVEWVFNVLKPHMEARAKRYEDARAQPLQQPQSQQTPYAQPSTAADADPAVARLRQQWEQGRGLLQHSQGAVPSGAVAPEGRKLRTTPWKTIVSIAGGVLFFGVWITINLLAD